MVLFFVLFFAVKVQLFYIEQAGCSGKAYERTNDEDKSGYAG